MSRKSITNKDIDRAFERMYKAALMRLKEKGYGVFVSDHEIGGVVTEEYGELVRSLSEGRKQFSHELVDVAVACLIGLASHEAGGCECC